ncbi:hypothetical protein [Parabacteroides distasonis]|uniref:hypothetical protein n=1 Tax=Parabacteroides distasonis TaxID=823 RepID=UPI0012B17AC0|nr:hypothetical protein [Parabacteroides distasonis]MRY42794.1 hypothetical protein [Parabacteroides distasonis]
MAQINEKWLEQSDDEWSYMTEVSVCKELGEILKKEGFDFEFNPNDYNGDIGGNKYFNIPVVIADIDEMFSVLYE